ncbi:MAG: amino acid adenylation domain-containing protein [Gordonia sp. (in: high G+C Gram-positive bacteria)]|uniref:amino acid adenylation domain-containing protein n=1 Tax=Gordonia sp. (in: high G+C Gram-positive bacteria) TaxID=84139 RepID=UPI0039E6D7AD
MSDVAARKRELMRQRLADKGLAVTAEPAVAAPRADGETSAVAVAQQRLWFVSYRDPADTSLIVPVALRVTGDLDAAALRRAFQTVVDRHETLRAVYEQGADGEPLMRHRTTVELPWTQHDLGDLGEQARQRRLAVLARREFATPFDLTADVPVRVTLIRTGADEHVLLLAAHHISVDDASWPVLFDEVAAAYRGADLPPLSARYADVASPADAAIAADLDHWRDHLSPLPDLLTLPGAEPVGTERRRSDRVLREIPADVVRAAAALAGARSSTPFAVYLAATWAYLNRITGAGDFLLAVPVTARPAGADGLIGYFGNSLLLRATVAPTDTFSDLIGRASGELADAIAHQAAPVDQVVAAVNRGSGQRRGGLDGAVSASLTARSEVRGPQIDGLAWEAVDELGVAAGQLPLEFAVVGDTVAGPVSLELEYDTAMIDEPTALGLVDSALAFLAAVVENPDAAIRRAPLLGDAQLAQALAAARGPAQETVDTTLTTMIESAAHWRGDRTALVDDDRELSHRELNATANRLARHLVDTGVDADDLVGLRCGASIDFVIAAVAVLKAGGAYLPIDPDYPDSRTDHLLSDASPRLTLDAAGIADAIAASAGLPDSDLTDADRRSPLRPGNLAYVIYTSGSTGLPKGVAVPHGAIADHLTAFAERGVVTADDRLVLTSSVSFDASVMELFHTLCVGGTVVLPKPKALADIPYLADLLVSRRVTVMHMVPSMLTTLLSIPEVKQWTMLRAVPVGGEALVADVANAFLTNFSAALSNNYGPTEAVVAATHQRVDAAQNVPVVPIGTPNANVHAHLLDAALSPVPTGVVGEIYLGGPQLARGYLGQPGLTAQRFVADPFADGQRLYRTGDLARRRADGAIEFVGRADEQVKVRGFRIELGEIGAAAATHPDVAHAIAIADETPAGTRLLAYAIPSEGAAIDAEAVRDHLGGMLPAYMVPDAVIAIDEVPQTVHGKLDRDALPRPGTDRSAGGRAPQTPTEQRVAAVYGQLFGRDDIAADDSFFDLGGHSLLAARLVTALTAEFGITIDVRLPFDHPTVAGLAGAIVAQVRSEVGVDLDEAGAAAPDVDFGGEAVDFGGQAVGSAPATPVRPPLVAGDPTDAAPLSFSQLAMWFADRFGGSGAHGNIVLPARLTGRVDASALTEALTDVVNHHDSLRTTFTERAGAPVAVVADQADLGLLQVDVSGAADPATAADTATREAAAHVFDIGAGPLVAATLITVSDTEHRLVLVVHHMVIDHASVDVVLGDLATAYRSRLAGGEPVLDTPTLRYADFARWQHDVFTDGGAHADFGRAEIEHWRTLLADVPDEILVAPDRPRPTALSTDGVFGDFTVPADVRTRLREVATGLGVTEFMALVGALTVALHRLGAGDDIVVGTPSVGRTDPGTERLVGLLANMVAIRTDLAGSTTVGDALQRTRNAALETFAHAEAPLERIVEAVNPRRTRARNPIFQVMLHFRERDENADGRDLADDLRLAMLPMEMTTSFLDLNVILAVTADGGLDGRLVACADLYDQATTDALAQLLVATLAEIAASPDAPLASAPALPDTLTADDHGEDVTRLAALLAERRPARVLASPATLTALPHAGVTDVPSVHSWVVSGPGAPASLTETLRALAPESFVVDNHATPEAPTAVGLALDTLGGPGQTPTECALIEILEGLLGVTGIGREDNFFAVGGDSVISLQWAAKAAEAGLVMSPQQVFDCYTIVELAESVDNGDGLALLESAIAEQQAAEEAAQPEAPAPMSASGLDDDLLASVSAAWKAQQ